jgi:sugar-phosphatase
VIRACVFDMDGVLIDTEPAWRTAEAAVFAALGIELTEAELVSSTGIPISDLVATWRRAHPPHARGSQLSDGEVAGQITDQVAAHVLAEGRPMPGVTEAVGLFERLRLRLAIASSSPRRLIDAVCERLGLNRIQIRCSALEEASGKPAPDVYLAAARRLRADPASCLAVEDSPHGIAAAKAAGMRCLAIPDPLLAADPRYTNADLVLPSLARLDERALRLLGVLPGA